MSLLTKAIIALSLFGAGLGGLHLITEHYVSQGRAMERAEVQKEVAAATEAAAKLAAEAKQRNVDLAKLSDKLIESRAKEAASEKNYLDVVRGQLRAQRSVGMPNKTTSGGTSSGVSDSSGVLDFADRAATAAVAYYRDAVSCIDKLELWQQWWFDTREAYAATYGQAAVEPVDKDTLAYLRVLAKSLKSRAATTGVVKQ